MTNASMMGNKLLTRLLLKAVSGPWKQLLLMLAAADDAGAADAYVTDANVTSGDPSATDVVVIPM